MSLPIQLLALNCLRCATPIPAQPQEVGWVCRHCGLAQRLNVDDRLAEMKIHYQQGIPDGATGRPFWVVEAHVSFERQTQNKFLKDKYEDARAFWQTPRRFFVPAFKTGLEEMIAAGQKMVRNPPQLSDGAAVAFRPITIRPQDIGSLIDFIVIAIEAERSDDLKFLETEIQVGEPICWVLP